VKREEDVQQQERERKRQKEEGERGSDEEGRKRRTISSMLMLKKMIAYAFGRFPHCGAGKLFLTPTNDQHNTIPLQRSPSHSPQRPVHNNPRAQQPCQ